MVEPEMENIIHKKNSEETNIFSRQKWLRKLYLKIKCLKVKFQYTRNNVKKQKM